MQSTLLRFGLPTDAVSWSALGLAAAALVLALTRARELARFAERRPRTVVAVLAASAALLSAGYVHHYLRGGPRIVDATSYFLEARALSQGLFAFDVPAPAGSFRGRFLVSAPESDALAVIFPPGYPALLALGFWLGEPLALGPLLAAALVVATFALARQAFGSNRVALVAAVLGVLCAALRYHTADTMSHGLGALLFTLALLGALRGGSGLLVAGIAVGWLVATRPVTGAAALALVLVAARRERSRAFALLCAGAIPGIALLLWHQHAATGSFWGSSQLRYYALADGPSGCFRYGFGEGIGCHFEHGDFVRARLDGGFGVVAAIGTTARRLHHHLLDVANLELLALLVPVAVVVGRRERCVRLLGLGVALLVLAYVPFYFDATYPGGGARLYAEVLPLEHVLVAWLVDRVSLARFVPAAALAGFSLHASFSHRALAEREGGRPMFEPALLEQAGVTRGLVFVSTDHGFNLGHRPGARDLVVARARADAHDFSLWQRLGRPPSHRYVYDPWAPNAVPRLEPYAPAPSIRFEGESLWPPLAIEGGHAYPAFPDGDCKSNNGALRLGPEGRDLRVTLGLTALAPGSLRLVTGWVASEGATVAVAIGGAAATGRPGPGCWRLEGPIVDADGGTIRAVLSVSGATAWLDYVELATPTSAHLSPDPAGKKR
jgi:hypothetical protein